MNNFIQPGDILPLTAPGGGVTSGTPVQIGQLLCIPVADAAATEAFQGQVRGVFTLPKTSAQAWTEGALVYWDDTASEVTTVADGNLPIGHAAAAAANPSDTGSVRIDPGAQGLAAGTSAASTVIYDHADDVGTNEAIAASGVARVVTVSVIITETLAGTTTTPIFEVGIGSDPDLFLTFNAGNAGDTLQASGTLAAGEALNVTVTDGTGGGEAGKASIQVLAVPAAA